MGHYCWICGRYRPNEAFSGKGHRRHQCRECSRLPKGDLEAIRITDFIGSVLFCQSNISKGNRKTLAGHLNSARSDIRDMARLALDVAQVKPHKRKRYQYLKAKHPHLPARLHQLFPGEAYDQATPDGYERDEYDETMWTMEPVDVEEGTDLEIPW